MPLIFANVFPASSSRQCPDGWRHTAGRASAGACVGHRVGCPRGGDVAGPRVGGAVGATYRQMYTVGGCVGGADEGARVGAKGPCDGCPVGARVGGRDGAAEGVALGSIEHVASHWSSGSAIGVPRGMTWHVWNGAPAAGRRHSASCCVDGALLGAAVGARIGAADGVADGLPVRVRAGGADGARDGGAVGAASYLHSVSQLLCSNVFTHVSFSTNRSQRPRWMLFAQSAASGWVSGCACPLWIYAHTVPAGRARQVPKPPRWPRQTAIGPCGDADGYGVVAASLGDAVGAAHDETHSAKAHAPGVSTATFLHT